MESPIVFVMIRRVEKVSEKLTIFQVLEKNQFNTGSVHQMFQAASGLAERGHRSFVVSRFDETLASRCRDAGVGFLPLPMRSEADVASMFAFARYVRRHRPDVIHVHKGIAHSIALGGTLRNRVKAFVVNRGVSFPLDSFNRIKYRTDRVDRIVTVCDQIRNVVIESGRIAPSKVQTIYAGCDVTQFTPEKWDRDDFRREKNIPPGSFLFAQVGVRDWKGWKELIDAFSIIHPEYPSSRLALIAVKSPQEAGVASYASERGVATALHAIEYRSDIARVLASADCVVDASWAGTGVTGTIREAMALSKPVIATDCGGNRELISSADVGWLVPPRNREELSRAMREVISSAGRAEQTGANAMQHVREWFSRERRLDRLEALYYEIVNGRSQI